MYTSLFALLLTLASSVSAQSSVAALVGSIRNAATEVDRLQVLSDEDVRITLNKHLTHSDDLRCSSFLTSYMLQPALRKVLGAEQSRLHLRTSLP